MSHDHSRLNDVLLPDVDVQWFEGVAVVQGVCRHLLASGAGSRGFPALSDVGINGDGSVTIFGTTPAKPVPAAAHMLAAMLSDDVPVRLRLLVTQATADEDTSSLREFSDAVAYFERPNPEQIVKRLYERAAAAARMEEARQTVGLFPAAGELVKAPPPAAPSASATSAPKRASRRAAVAVMMAAVVGAAVWVTRVGTADGHVSAAVGTVKEMIKESFAAPPNAPAAEIGAQPEAAPAKAAKRAPAARTRQPGTGEGSRASGSAASPALRAPLVTPALASLPPLEGGVGSMFTLPWSGAVAAAAIVTSSGTVAAVPADRGEDAIYSKLDSHVTPVRQVYPAMPAETSEMEQREDRAVIELVIAADGRVERVRMRTRPRDVHEFMLLSAAKAWRFKPAMLAGQPVRFLHSVAITTID